MLSSSRSGLHTPREVGPNRRRRRLISSTGQSKAALECQRMPCWLAHRRQRLPTSQQHHTKLKGSSVDTSRTRKRDSLELGQGKVPVVDLRPLQRWQRHYSQLLEPVCCYRGPFEEAENQHR